MRFSRKALPLALLLGLTVTSCSLFRAAQRPAPEIAVERTPELIARGDYLANHVMSCTSCHSFKPGTHLPDYTRIGAGGGSWGAESEFPGTLYASNITPHPETGLGNWTDGGIIRAIREGVSKDGRALFPLMPYPNYREMSDDDARAIVAYLRSLKPIDNKVPERKLDFPLNFLVNTMPQPLETAVPPPPKETVAYGKHLFTMASCNECHTVRDDRGQPVMEQFLAGGHNFPGHYGPQGTGIIVPNITQDMATGIGGWTDQQIIDAIANGRRPDGKVVREPMPWQAYNGMKQEDLKAIVAYLRTVPPIANKVENRW